MLQGEPARDPLSLRVWALGVPLAPLTTSQVIEAVDSLIQARRPGYFITANLNYAMLTCRHHDLAEINRDATFIVADGMSLVWAARRQGTPVPQRVAGSDLIFKLSRLAANRGYRIYLLGGQPGVAEQASKNLVASYPGLRIAGTESPWLAGMNEIENTRLIDRVRASGADLLLVALGQPKGERWIHQNYQAMKVPLCVQIGASIDFAAGRVRRAPSWMQEAGLEWVFRLAMEPRRLTRRYLENGLFFLREQLRIFGKPRVDSAKSGPPPSLGNTSRSAAAAKLLKSVGNGKSLATSFSRESEDSMHYALVIPALNEEEAIAPTLRRARSPR